MHGSEDAEERPGAIGERRVVENIKLCDRERVWYIICRSIIVFVDVLLGKARFEVVMERRH